MTAPLTADADSYTWAAAAIGSNTAAGYQLASEEPVMAIGRLQRQRSQPPRRRSSSSTSPTATYFIASGDGFGGGRGMSAGGSSSTEISSWVSESFTATTVDGVTVYDLSGGVQ